MKTTWIGAPIKMLSLAGMAAALSFPVSNAFATTVTAVAPFWVLLPGSDTAGTPTYAVPNPGTEGPAEFLVDQPFDLVTASGGGATAAGFWLGIREATDPSSPISDIITFRNTGLLGNGAIDVFSDSDPGTDFASLIAQLVSDGVTGFQVCAENSSGCGALVTELITSNPAFTVRFISDGDGANTFDPFGFGFNTSDQIKFTGVTAPVPLPAALPLFAGGLGLMGWLARRRKRQAA